MPKEYVKITVEDLDIAENFFGNDKQFGEFLVAVTRYYKTGKVPPIKTKLVARYFHAYKKTMDFILQAKHSGSKGGSKRAVNQSNTNSTLEGSLNGSVKGDSRPLQPNSITNKELNNKKDNSIIDNNKLSFSDINISLVENKNKPYFEEAKAFYDLILTNQKKINSPGARKIEKNPAKKWIDQIRLMKTEDGITTDQMRQVWAFLGKDDFWSKTCQSPENLRKNFSKIYNKSKRKNGKETNIPSREEIKNAVKDFYRTNSNG